MEEALDAAGFVGTEYLLERKLRGRAQLADPAMEFDVMVRRLRMLVDNQPTKWWNRRRRHSGRFVVRVEVAATMWIVILEPDRILILNAYPWDWQ